MQITKNIPTILYWFLIIGAAMLLFAACSKDNNPTTPETGVKNSDIKILVLKDGGTEDTVYSVLSKSGFDVTVGDYYYNFDGKFISNYNLVILLNGVDYNNDISDSTQSRLRNYVRDGGILLTTEWMTWSIANTNHYQIIKDFLPVVYNGSYSYGTETYTKMVDNPITEGLPNSFSVSDTNWNYSNTTLYNNSLSSNLKVLFRGDKSGAALTMGELNKGKTIHWNMAGAYEDNTIWTPEVKKILINIARYSGM
jgi:hypothetical protein